MLTEKIAVPRGPIAYDEASQGTNGRTRAKSYNPNKPDKHAIRFYTLNGTKPNYCFAIMDNGTGNYEPLSPAERYLRQFPGMRTMFRKATTLEDPKNDDPPLDPASPSALYALMMAHPVYKDSSYIGVRGSYTDSFYTRHNVARCLFLMTGGKMKLTGAYGYIDLSCRLTSSICCPVGTCKFNQIEACNKIGVSKAVTLLKDAPRGSWCIVPAYAPVDEVGVEAQTAPANSKASKKKKKTFKNKALIFRRKGITTDMKRYPIAIGSGKTKETISCVKATNAGYILWKDNKIVTFYTNDLACDVPERQPNWDGVDDVISIISGRDTYRLPIPVSQCLRGTASVQRWTDENHAHRASVMVPSHIVAYNMFMNGVDVMDQLRGYCKTKRRDKNLSTSMVGFLLDFAIHNAYGVYKVSLTCNVSLFD